MSVVVAAVPIDDRIYSLDQDVRWGHPAAAEKFMSQGECGTVGALLDARHVLPPDGVCRAIGVAFSRSKEPRQAWDRDKALAATDQEPKGTLRDRVDQQLDLQGMQVLLMEAAAREAQLRVALREEEELHHCALHLLQQSNGDEEKNEVETLSRGFEDQAADMLELQFEMVNMKNQFDAQTSELRSRIEELTSELECSKTRYVILQARSHSEIAALRDELAVAREEASSFVAKLEELEVELHRCRISEAEAIQKVQELQTTVKVLQEFGQDDWLQGDLSRTRSDEEFLTPLKLELDSLDSCQDGAAVATPPKLEMCVSSVAGKDNPKGLGWGETLISAEVDLGLGVATLSVATWQLRSDFEAIVQQFLADNKVKPIFAEALVTYLEELEDNASSFPVVQQANLADLYCQYG